MAARPSISCDRARVCAGRRASGAGQGDQAISGAGERREGTRGQGRTACIKVHNGYVEFGRRRSSRPGCGAPRGRGVGAFESGWSKTIPANVILDDDDPKTIDGTDGVDAIAARRRRRRGPRLAEGRQVMFGDGADVLIGVADLLDGDLLIDFTRQDRGRS
jgi:hypothetical protein